MIFSFPYLLLFQISKIPSSGNSLMSTSNEVVNFTLVAPSSPLFVNIGSWLKFVSLVSLSSGL